MPLVLAQTTPIEATVCCEKTLSGNYCQDVPVEECSPDSRQVPTACESTSFCKPGFCFDSVEGTCLDNTPQLVCNNEDGIWSETQPPQCDLGCCVLGDQAAFVSQTRCKRLSSFLGLETNYRTGLTDEVSCILSVQNQEKGACVFESEFERTCRFTTRADCQGEFHVGKLCSAEELGTNCGPTRETICVPGKDEVYFIDTCGNPANIYDASKINNKAYWSDVLDKSEACNPNSENANSQTCGNCNYLLGSFCREANSQTANPTYGSFICADLNCENTQNGQSYKHGESWCVYNDAGSVDSGKNSVGSRFYRHICINGEEVLEQCDDLRQKECTEDTITTPLGTFSQAACTVNRWQDCTSQTNKIDCENTDRRDCLWQQKPYFSLGNVTGAACIPKNPPGLMFWQGEETKSICSQANTACVVTFEEGLFGGKECVKNCHCLEQGWENQRAELCTAIGDCGPNVNWAGQEGSREGFKITTEKR